MKLEIDMIDHTETLSEEQGAFVRDLLFHAAKEEGLEEDAYELSLSFVNDDEIREMNREYRGKDAATDVISFALNETVEGEETFSQEGIPNMLGDIIISIERTKEQATEYGHSFDRELGFLIVHGFLHLLGYDHMTEEDEKKMFSRQEELLAGYGLTRPE